MNTCEGSASLDNPHQLIDCDSSFIVVGYLYRFYPA
ncbi:hypothetical protein Riv7116_3361 [Rivularia sp. PCC 7116]|nr:hypothetical protein Riv7116_3361 [Rivularia sp. PCC 7116]